jgi:hypothetical protein
MNKNIALLRDRFRMFLKKISEFFYSVYWVYNAIGLESFYPIFQFPNLNKSRVENTFIWRVCFEISTFCVWR